MRLVYAKWCFWIRLATCYIRCFVVSLVYRPVGLSSPFLAQNLDFYGVIRFFFQDNQQSVATTKCLRVSSTATSKMVIEALIEKFRPDMRMLGSSYALYEVHQNGGVCVCVHVCVSCMCMHACMCVCVCVCVCVCTVILYCRVNTLGYG